jgi:membrane protein
MKETLINVWKLLKLSFEKFGDENTMNMAAALAYYTIFSLPPILIIIINIAGVFLEEQSFQLQLQQELSGLVGANGAAELMNTIGNIGVFQKQWWATGISIVALILASTTVFITIQRSLNDIFRVKAKPRIGIIKVAVDRMISFAMVLSITFILLISLMLNAIVAYFGDWITRLLPGLEMWYVNTTSVLLPFFITIVLFALIFRLLPDARMKWKDAFVGASITALLFSIGKFLIGYYVGKSNVASLYDAAGSVLVIMVWIFYSSIIFFFGAQVTYVYANIFGGKIRPSNNAVRIFLHEEPHPESEKRV